MARPMGGKSGGKFANKRRDSGNRGLFKRRKFCRFTAEKVVEEVDYKDIDMLKEFIAENGKHHSGPHYRHQGALPAPAGHRDQACALPGALPYTDLH